MSNNIVDLALKNAYSSNQVKDSLHFIFYCSEYRLLHRHKYIVSGN